jgi:hypothetical protein
MNVIELTRPDEDIYTVRFTVSRDVYPVGDHITRMQAQSMAKDELEMSEKLTSGTQYEVRYSAWERIDPALDYAHPERQYDPIEYRRVFRVRRWSK